MKQVFRNFRTLGAAALLAGAFAAAAYAQQGQPQQEQPSSVDTFAIPDNITILSNNDLGERRATAIVNGTIITGSDVEQRVALVLAANDTQQVPADELKRLRLQVLRNLIDETLQIQEAKAQEMDVKPEEVDETFQQVAQQRFDGSIERLEAYLRSVGSSPESLKRQIEGELAMERLMRRNVTPFVNVSSEEVNEVYDRVIAAKGTAEYRIGEIYLSATPATRTAVTENARRIVEQLRQGGSFVAYARQFSEASTAAVGGDLGWIRLEQLQNPQLEAAARGMAPGQLAGPIEIPGGFSILYMIDKRQIGMADPRDAVLSLKQISLDFAPGTSAEDARAKAAAFAQGVSQIHGCGEANAAAAQLGAQVVDNDQIQVKALPEQLQSSLLELSIGQYYGPFGSLEEGVRVLMLCGRDDPAPEAAGPDRDQIASSIEDDRVNKRWQRYLRDLRRDAVIEYN
ncbi:MAG TPA: peptidylprolyl isomerase [Croceibacterium sp.]|nr:peptidylprolyl isomerase [Croceibacterium sp.]